VTASAVWHALSATWPAEEAIVQGALTLRRSPGGGSRVTAATFDGRDAPGDALLDDADAQMRGWGQVPTYRVRDDQTAVDRCLAARGLTRHDRTRLYAIPARTLARSPPHLVTFDIWPPLAIQTEIWANGGIGPDRMAVMERTAGPRTALFARHADRPAGTGFVAADGRAAMVHALEVPPACRRAGVARHMMAHAALWALRHGCDTLAVAVTDANAPACALYAGLGMVEVGRYHYRKGTVDA